MEDKKVEVAVRQKGLLGRVVLAVLAVVVPLVLAVALILMLSLNMMCSDRFPSVQQTFVTTILETGQLKFLASWFLSPEEIQGIVDENSMEALNAEVNEGLIQIESVPTVGEAVVSGEDAADMAQDIEIVEVHHTRKVDAPSGTAHMLFNAIKEVRPNAYENCGRAGEGKRTKDEIGIHALRMGNVVGIHEVHICTPSQTLTLRHEAVTRAMLADGAVDAARFMLGKPKGLYNMENILER